MKSYLMMACIMVGCLTGCGHTMVSDNPDAEFDRQAEALENPMTPDDQMPPMYRQDNPYNDGYPTGGNMNYQSNNNSSYGYMENAPRRSGSHVSSGGGGGGATEVPFSETRKKPATGNVGGL